MLLTTIPAKLETDPYIEMLNSDGTLCYIGAESTHITLLLLPMLINHMLEIADTHGVKLIVEKFPLNALTTQLPKYATEAFAIVQYS